SAESNRMLGLAFQGQGQLDMAFDKFRKVPLDSGVMEVLYNLGLDFERKRQFNKAESVFRYMSEYDPEFCDLPQRMKRMQNLSQTVMLGGTTGSRMRSRIMLESDGITRPTLGRYVIEKELGNGAMGVVYFGRDPRIGREMAIKTMSLSQEFAGKELDEARERFFREAESAGRLNHPDIVAIYDAGEEHDLAYIAMEYLRGEDLTAYAEAGNLLPLATLMELIARVADALDYAHRQNVVHRDIKPANIMYDAATNMLKVTDFGLARITDANKTRTGVIYGTPSYMSPEQLAGKKIDGQSDLFSLGVTLYQLACGKLPFEGDSLAQLMYRIAYNPPPDILDFRSDLPPCLVAVINKALSKRHEDRYANGEEMADALRRCAASLQGQSQSAGVNV
ncbi:MAG: serine/threonine-protein kinase, partial [Gallionella sp.]|nr:serine/threonine-protein kinase [Gallionella sp.]